MKAHISKVCKVTYFHLRNIGAIRKLISRDACAKLIHALVTSRIDYGNALLMGVPNTQLKRLQRILHVAARIVSLTCPSDPVEPVLKSLHWLPIKSRVEYKILLVTFKALNGTGAGYLKDLLVPYNPSRSLRSSDANLLKVPSTVLKTCGDRAFYSAAPRLWNGLPKELRCMTDVTHFKKALKTHLFNTAY